MVFIESNPQADHGRKFKDNRCDHVYHEEELNAYVNIEDVFGRIGQFINHVVAISSVEQIVVHGEGGNAGQLHHQEDDDDAVLATGVEVDLYVGFNIPPAAPATHAKLAASCPLWGCGCIQMRWKDL